MKKKIYFVYLFILHFLIYHSCRFSLPSFCAFLIKISLYQPKNFRKNYKNKKKKIIIFNRSIGGLRDVEIIYSLSNNLPEPFFIRRSIAKIIFTYFCYKKNFFFNYVKPKNKKLHYFDISLKKRKMLEIFCTKVIVNLKKYFKKSQLEFITFAYYYDTEFGLYAGCKNNNLAVKLWSKECFMSDPYVQYRIKENKYKDVFKYFSKISVYNNTMKKMMVAMDENNISKIYVNGYPRIIDFQQNKKTIKKIKNILFLSFNPISGIPENKNINFLNFQFSFDKVVSILNDLAKNKKIHIMIKKKNNKMYKSQEKLSKNIKVFETGTSEKFINKADIIIGHNSSSTVEALVNGKIVMVPFFENKSKLKKYLYKFSKDIIYNSKEKMKNKIESLINKKTRFPQDIKKSIKTINYYFGNTKNVKNNFINFLNY